MVSKLEIDEFRLKMKSLEDSAKRPRQGRLSPLERIEVVADPGTFEQIDAFLESLPPKFGRLKGKVTTKQGVITGRACVHGKQVYLYAQDSSVEAGALGEREGRKICKVMDLAVQNGAPVIALNDSGGARVSEGVRSSGYWNIFQRNVIASGVVPQIFAIMGSCAGGGAYSPALGDFIFMIKEQGSMFVTGPTVVKSIIGQEISKEGLGGPQIHSQVSGVAHFLAPTERECLDMIRTLLSYLPSNNREKPPFVDTGDDPWRTDESVGDVVPEDPKKSYDMRQVIRKVFDRGEFFEVHRYFAQNILTGFARLAGNSVGVVASQPRFLAGCLDINASDKAARFIRFCDAFNIPLINLVDVPGYLPGIEQEHGGILRHGAKMIFAYAEATVPKITLVLRKAYGGALSGMCVSKERGADEVMAWVSAEVATLGADAAVKIFFAEEIRNSADPEKRRQELIKEFQEEVTSVYAVAAAGRIERIIEPKDTRPALVKALRSHSKKLETLPWKKHGNIPL
jgi:acetyl-CoA carboxylase carboxyltransferase component